MVIGAMVWKIIQNYPLSTRNRIEFHYMDRKFIRANVWKQWTFQWERIHTVRTGVKMSNKKKQQQQENDITKDKEAKEQRINALPKQNQFHSMWLTNIEYRMFSHHVQLLPLVIEFYKIFSTHTMHTIFGCILHAMHCASAGFVLHCFVLFCFVYYTFFRFLYYYGCCKV